MTRPLMLGWLLLSVYISSGNSQPDIDGCLLSDLMNEDLSRELGNSDNVNSGDGNPVTVVILDRNAVCEAVGRRRDRFRFRSEVITFTGRSSQPSTPQVALVDFMCVAVSGELVEWQIINDGFRYITTNAEAAELGNSTLISSCSSCSGTAPSDENPICTMCHSNCLIEEQFLCYGSDQDTCCNVYIDGVCANNCPINQVPAAVDFECVCSLICTNGGSPLGNCTGCICPAGDFTGPLCENPCVPNPCLNSGSCTADVTYPNTTCTCAEGFTGDFCEMIVDPCNGVSCSNNGTCRVVNTTQFVCDCNPGFMGTDCEIEINQCDSNNCSNSAMCIREDFPNYRCECRPNFSGEFCEICNLPNCQTCSLTDKDVCEVCFLGFLLTDSKTCAVNCSICNERESQCSKNTCHYYCLLNAWSVDVNTQGLIVPSFQEPPANIPRPDKLQQIITDASEAEELWTAAARQTSGLSSLQPPARTGITISEWVSASEQWISNTIEWLTQTRADLPDFTEGFEDNLQAIVDDGLLSSDPQASFEQVTDIWREINNEYNRLIIAMQQGP